MLKKQFSLSFVIVLVLSLVLTACGSGNNNTAKTPDSSSGNQGSSDEKISGTITFLTNRTDMIGKEYDDYLKRFQEKYPDVTIEFEAGQSDYNQQVKVRMASGELPDVLFIPQIPNSDLPKYFSPLDDLGLNDRIAFKDFHAYEGKVYGIATGSATAGIVYNKKAFADAGITEIPKTWDEFLAACEKLKQNNIIPFASNFKDKWPLNTWVYDTPRLIENNADFGNAKLDTDTPFTLDNGYGKAFSLLKELNEKGYLEPDINSTNWEQSKKDIAAGKIGMYYLGNWVINQIIGAGTTSDNVGFFPLPYDNSGTLHAGVSPDFFYGVAKDSKNLPAAKAFVKWMLEESGYEDFAGFIPPLKDRDSKLPQLVEFQSTGVELQEITPDNPKVTEITNKAQLDIPAVVQEFVLAKDPQTVFDKWNTTWSKAKKDLGY